MRSITRSAATIVEDNLMNHYWMFRMFIKFNKKNDPSILGSKEIIQAILKKENITLFNNVKVIIQLISVAYVQVAVESLISWHEKLFDSSRLPTETHSMYEMIIAEDGPTTSCWWNTRTSNEPILEHCKQWW